MARPRGTEKTIFRIEIVLAEVEPVVRRVVEVPGEASLAEAGVRYPRCVAGEDACPPVQLVPDPGALPVPQPPPARRARRTPQLARQVDTPDPVASTNTIPASTGVRRCA
jgi:hypothetical protein